MGMGVDVGGVVGGVVGVGVRGGVCVICGEAVCVGAGDGVTCGVDVGALDVGVAEGVGVRETEG